MTRLDYVGNRLSLNPKLAKEQSILREIKNLLKTNGNIITAIKIHRSFYGLGLKETKDAVEAIQNGLKPRRRK